MLNPTKHTTTIQENGDILEEYTVKSPLSIDIFHCEDGPARILTSSYGQKITEEYYLNDQLHRSDGPAWISYYPNGNIKYTTYFKMGVIHNYNRPASTAYYEDGKLKAEIYCIDGQNHNENRPAIIEYDEEGNITFEQYNYDGVKYNSLDELKAYANTITKKKEKNGEFVEYYPNGNISKKSYYEKDVLHNHKNTRKGVFEPALSLYYEDGKVKYEEYRMYNRLNRYDGPAIIHYDEKGNIISTSYYKNDVDVTNDTLNLFIKLGITPEYNKWSVDDKNKLMTNFVMIGINPSSDVNVKAVRKIFDNLNEIAASSSNTQQSSERLGEHLSHLKSLSFVYRQKRIAANNRKKLPFSPINPIKDPIMENMKKIGTIQTPKEALSECLSALSSLASSFRNNRLRNV